MRTQTLVILPKAESYSALRDTDAFYMKQNIKRCIDDIAGGLNKTTFVLQDELALQFFGNSCENWISCLSIVDDTILRKISPMPEIYYKLSSNADKLDKKLLTEISKKCQYPDKSKSYDETHYNGLRLQTMRLRIGEALSTAYNMFDLVIYISKGNSFMKKPVVEQGRDRLIMFYDLNTDTKQYYYAGIEVYIDIFNKVRGGLIL